MFLPNKANFTARQNRGGMVTPCHCLSIARHLALYIYYRRGWFVPDGPANGCHKKSSVVTD
jgi:hypothetical protein